MVVNGAHRRLGRSINKSIVIVGGGPAGLMAACRAGRLGACPVLVERGDQVGRKLLLTGQGRCNFSNISPITEFIEHFGPNGRFLRNCLSRFGHDELVCFFREGGLGTITEHDGRSFPATQKAADVINVLVNAMQRFGVEMRTKTTVLDLMVSSRRVVGVRTNHGNISADLVVLATGGMSYPETGSTGDGMRFAELLGHDLTPPRPALVPLITDAAEVRGLQGIALSRVGVRINANGRRIFAREGELIFTHHGLSGPVILDASRAVCRVPSGLPLCLSLDLVPTWEKGEHEAWLGAQAREGGRSLLKRRLQTLVPARLAERLVERAGVSLQRKCAELTRAERRRIAQELEGMRFGVRGIGGFEEAMITSGGVVIKGIDPRTMASRLVSGLYLCGEVLDLDADTGGYNLQAAFSTGFAAGDAAARQFLAA